ncbi:MAG: metallophosphoesterase family protein [Massiliimalia sp.]
MKIAVLSDIHGNYAAIKRCIDYAVEQGAEQFFFLGDYIGELPFPDRTLDVLYQLKKEYPCQFILGNREEYFLDYYRQGRNDWEDGNSVTGTLYYTYHALRKQDLEFFAELPDTQVVSFPGLPELILCHGSPGSVKRRLYFDDDYTLDVIRKTEQKWILCGHTHRQMKLCHDGTQVLNPGSIGLPLTAGKGKTQFIMLHGEEENWREELLTLDYDVSAAVKSLYEAKMDQHAPLWTPITVSILNGEGISYKRVLDRAIELCREETGDCQWPEIPERFMGAALEELIGIKPAVLPN